MSTPPSVLEQPIQQRPANEITVKFEDVSIAFEDKVVLDGVSFELLHGETKAIFGVAGSG